MNILYLSKHTSHNKDTGPFWSIPCQVAAQSRYDNVLWFNMRHGVPNEWKNKVKNFVSLDGCPGKRLDALPKPFNAPDLVVFESVYSFPLTSIVFDVWKKRIPYIIIPRVELTQGAQRRKAWKKIPMNFLFFYWFTRKAIAIQYLTENEYLSSGDIWNKTHIIIPNGVNPPRTVKTRFNKDCLNGVFIGRLSTFHKGLDLLIDACDHLQSEFRENHCSITFYGPDRENCKKDLVAEVEKKQIGDFLKFADGSVFGQEKEKILLNSDFFVLSSRMEGHPTGVLDALSHGVPCLVTEGSNMGKEIIQYDAGWSSETTVNGIISSFRRLFAERNNLYVKGRNAIELSKLYDWDALARKSSQIYRNLLKKE